LIPPIAVTEGIDWRTTKRFWKGIIGVLFEKASGGLVRGGPMNQHEFEKQRRAGAHVLVGRNFFEKK
jgi:hypothetical protein